MISRIRNLMNDEFILNYDSSLFESSCKENIKNKENVKIKNKDEFLKIFEKEGLYYLDLMTSEHTFLILVEEGKIFLIQSYICFYNCRIDEIIPEDLEKIWNIEHSRDKPFYEELFHVSNFKEDTYNDNVRGIFFKSFNLE